MSDHYRYRPSAGFTCKHCKQPAAAIPYGTQHRNHCPWCLWSVHVDDTPGDRGCGCHGSMEPIGIWVKRDGEWAVIHHCASCGALRTNRIAGDDSPWALLALAARALSRPPFPID